MATQFLLEKLKGRDDLEELGLDWRMILKWNFKLFSKCVFDPAAPAQEPVVRCWEHGAELSYCMK